MLNLNHFLNNLGFWYISIMDSIYLFWWVPILTENASAQMIITELPDWFINHSHHFPLWFDRKKNIKRGSSKALTLGSSLLILTFLDFSRWNITKLLITIFFQKEKGLSKINDLYLSFPVEDLANLKLVTFFMVWMFVSF